MVCDTAVSFEYSVHNSDKVYLFPLRFSHRFLKYTIPFSSIDFSFAIQNIFAYLPSEAKVTRDYFAKLRRNLQK